MMNVASAGNGWVGSYTPVVLSRVLKRAAEEGQTGALSVVSGPSVKKVHFINGSVAFAASNIRRDRLGESMLAHEFISESDYDLASRKMQSEGCRFGEALLSLGRVTEKELERELAIQVQRIVLSLFRLPEGMYSFEEGERVAATLPFGLSVPTLLLKGLRSIEDGKVILSALPPADHLLRVAMTPPHRFDARKLSDAERSILDLAGDGRCVGDIIRSCRHGQSAAFRSVFVLLTLGLLEPVATEAELAEPALGGDEKALASLIDETFAKLDHVSEADLLGVRHGAPLAEVETAYDELTAEWAEARDHANDPELVEKIRTIELRLAAAFAQLVVAAEPATPAPSTPPRDDFTTRARVAQLERDAELHLQVREWKGGMSLLQELVALVPDCARYRSMLGEAMQHQSSTRRDAEQHFLEAVRLEPAEARFRIALGRYYRRLGNHARALAELHKARELDPRNRDAIALLQSWNRSPSRMQKLLHRVFG